MKAAIYYQERKQENLMANVELEVVPRGLYEIDGISYQFVGQPRFIIEECGNRGDRGDRHQLVRVELIVVQAPDQV